jgi:mono/diheme cytochrome c family protein
MKSVNMRTGMSLRTRTDVQDQRLNKAGKGVFIERMNIRSEKLKGMALTVVALVSFSASLHTGSSVKTRAETIPQNDADSNVLFARNCSSCHGKDGRAKTLKGKLNHAQNLTSAKWQGSISDEHVFISILKGKDKMPLLARSFRRTRSRHS